MTLKVNMKLKEILEQRKLTQEVLSEKTGISQSQISMIVLTKDIYQ